MTVTITSPSRPPNTLARTRRTTQTVPSILRLWASRYIQMATRMTKTRVIRQIAIRKPRNPPVKPPGGTWNAPCIRPGGAPPVYISIARTGPGETWSRSGRRSFAARAVRVRPVHGRVAHAVLVPAVLALDPHADGQVLPVPRELAAIGADFGVGGPHHRSAMSPPYLRLLGSVSDSVRAGCERHSSADSLAASLRLDLDRVADHPLSQRVDEVADPAQSPTAQGCDHVSDLEAGRFRRGSGRDLCEEHAAPARDSVIRGEAAAHVVPVDAEPRPLHVPVLQDLAGDAERRVDRDREADAFRERNRRRVNCDDAAAQVHERPAAVPRVHGGVRLDDGQPVPGPAGQAPPEGADHTRRDGRPAGKPERIADRKDGLAHLEFVRIREIRRPEVLPVHADDRYVGLLVPADDRAAQDPSIVEGDDHLVRAFDHVVGREDVLLVVADHARADAPPRPRTERRPVRASRRAHVDRALSRPLHRPDVRILQICQHGPPIASAAYVERVSRGVVTRRACGGTRAGRGSRARCRTG